MRANPGLTAVDRPVSVGQRADRHGDGGTAAPPESPQAPRGPTERGRDGFVMQLPNI